MSLLEFTDKGIYCSQAQVYLDPWKPVDKALITHGHADHAYVGNRSYLCTTQARPVIQHRLNTIHNVQGVEYGETITINGVQFSFHPAGHIPGSAQIRVAYQGEVWCFSGDYKLQADGISVPFEPVQCHVFITESTFGLPVYRWTPQRNVFDEIDAWWRSNKSEGKVSVLAGYTLGKAQRILRNVDASIGRILVHGAVDSVTIVLRAQGIQLPETVYVTKEMKKKDWEGALIICPPSALGSPWIRKFMPYSFGIASGWMSLRGIRRRRGADRGFVLSDHADWEDLNKAIKATGAEKVFVTHGYSEIFAQWLRDQGLDAHDVKTQYEGEVAEMAESTTSMNEDSEAYEVDG